MFCKSFAGYRVEFEDVHRLGDGQVKHSPEFFYAGSLWKVVEYEDPFRTSLLIQFCSKPVLLSHIIQISLVVSLIIHSDE